MGAGPKPRQAVGASYTGFTAAIFLDAVLIDASDVHLSGIFVVELRWR
jgi:hypothetical protein